MDDKLSLFLNDIVKVCLICNDEISIKDITFSPYYKKIWPQYLPTVCTYICYTHTIYLSYSI